MKKIIAAALCAALASSAAHAGEPITSEDGKESIRVFDETVEVGNTKVGPMAFGAIEIISNGEVAQGFIAVTNCGKPSGRFATSSAEEIKFSQPKPYFRDGSRVIDGAIREICALGAEWIERKRPTGARRPAPRKELF